MKGVRSEFSGGTSWSVEKSTAAERQTLAHTISATDLVFPGGSDGKESACKAGDLGSTPGLGRSPGGGHGNPLQYSCLENPMDRGAQQATVHRVAQSQTRLKQPSSSSKSSLYILNTSSLSDI